MPRAMAIASGQCGHITAVYANDEYGNLYVVRLESGEWITCPWAALRKSEKKDK